MKNDFAKSVIGIGLIIVAFLLICYGVLDGEINTVFSKAVNICMECIGIG